MSIDVSWSAFKDFANANGRGAYSTEVATFLGGKNVVSLSDNRVGGNAACSIGKRTDDAKARNNQTRAALICALLKAYTFEDLDAGAAVSNIKTNAKKGIWTIDQNVLDKIAEKIGSDDDGLSLKDFNCGKPLTARRIKKIEKAIKNAMLAGVEDDDALNKAHDNIDLEELEEGGQNPYLLKCFEANDVDSFLANASMAFALANEDDLDETVLTIAQVCSCFDEKTKAKIDKYIKNVGMSDADRAGFKKLQNVIDAIGISHNILTNFLIEGIPLTEKYEVKSIPIPKVGKERIEGYVNSDNAKTFISKFNAVIASYGNDEDKKKICVTSILTGEAITSNNTSGDKVDGDDVIDLVKAFKKVVGTVCFSNDLNRGFPIELDNGAKENDIIKGNGDETDYADVAEKLINYFKIGEALQTASLAKFLILATQRTLSVARAAFVYRPNGDDESDVNYPNKMGVVPILACTPDNAPGSTPIKMFVSKKNGVFTYEISENATKEQGDISSADKAYFELVANDATTKYDSNMLMGKIHHEINVTLELPNDEKNLTKVLYGTISATYTPKTLDKNESTIV